MDYKRQKKMILSCEFCRKNHRKCNYNNKICTECLKRGIVCVPMLKVKKKSQRKSKQEGVELSINDFDKIFNDLSIILTTSIILTPSIQIEQKKDHSYKEFQFQLSFDEEDYYTNFQNFCSGK